MLKDTFFCPLYSGHVSAYDCDEMSFGARHGFLLNDGILSLLPIEQIRTRREICKSCRRFKIKEESVFKNRE